MGFLLLITVVQIFASLHAIKRGFNFHYIALILIAPIVGALIHFWMYYSPFIVTYLKKKVLTVSVKKKFLILRSRH